MCTIDLYPVVLAAFGGTKNDWPVLYAGPALASKYNSIVAITPNEAVVTGIGSLFGGPLLSTGNGRDLVSHPGRRYIAAQERP